MSTRTGKHRSHMRDYTSAPVIRNPRSTFDLSHPVKITFDSGLLIPFEAREVLPGDTFKVSQNIFLRIATLIKPIMDNVYFDVHWWFCPNRQLQENWPKLMGEQDNPGDSTDFLVPQVAVESAGNSNTFAGTKNTMGDYMGVVPRDQVNGDYLVNALPARMYNRVYNFHYRDENLQPSIPQSVTDVQDPSTDYPLRRRGKRHDYLTSSAIEQQKGDPVPIAIAGLAPLTAQLNAQTGDTIYAINPNEQNGRWTMNSNVGGTGPLAWNSKSTNTTLNVFADLGASTSASITQLRQSIAIQHILERDMRSGTRYPEQLVSRFGVVDPQLLVHQRPEFLGGTVIPLNISPVPQTTPTQSSGESSSTQQGNLAAVGTASAGRGGFVRSFTEHGWILGIISARADLTYQQGVERQWFKRERFDYFTPELANISEQPVFNKEIYIDGADGADDNVWGFQGVYDEYRSARARIAGTFRSKASATLESWHLSQLFQSRPALNGAFIEDNPPIKRVIAVQDEPEFIGDIFINMTVARILPLTGIPGLNRI